MKVAQITQKYFEAAGTAVSIWSKKQEIFFFCLTFTGMEIFSCLPRKYFFLPGRNESDYTLSTNM